MSEHDIKTLFIFFEGIAIGIIIGFVLAGALHFIAGYEIKSKKEKPQPNVTDEKPL